MSGCRRAQGSQAFFGNRNRENDLSCVLGNGATPLFNLLRFKLLAFCSWDLISLPLSGLKRLRFSYIIGIDMLFTGTWIRRFLRMVASGKRIRTE